MSAVEREGVTGRTGVPGAQGERERERERETEKAERRG